MAAASAMVNKSGGGWIASFTTDGGKFVSWAIMRLLGRILFSLYYLYPVRGRVVRIPKKIFQ
jgi:hypothetical protein